MSERIPWCSPDYYRFPVCMASVRRNPDTILGVICFHDFIPAPSGESGLMVEMSAAGADPRWLTKDLIRFAFGYAFGQLDCRRMNTVTPASNLAAQKVDEKLGFTLEGRIRKAMPNGDDALFYGMLREECRWLEGGPNGRQEQRIERT